MPATSGDGSPASQAGFEQARDFGRVVLPVAVHRHDPGRARRADPGDQRRRLAAAPVVAQHPDRAVARPQHAQPFRGRVIAAVIDIDQLERPERARRLHDFGGNRRDVLGFVEDRDDDRKARPAGFSPRLPYRTRTLKSARGIVTIRKERRVF